MATSSKSVAAELSGIVGEKCVLNSDQIANLDPGFHPDNLVAEICVAPASTKEVSDILSLCQREGIAIVPQGGRTGLSGGAVTTSRQVIVSLARMTAVERVDPLAAVAVVEAGASLQSVEDEARHHGLSCGIDLAARGTATIGGMISTNAGGMEAFRNGSMRHRIAGLEVVLANGDVLSEMTEVTKCNEGYDLKQLFCGAEGTLGVVTRAVLRLEPEPPMPTTLLVACNNATDALGIMRACQRTADLDLLHAEIMWRPAAERIAQAVGLSAVLSFCKADVYVIIEVVCRSGAGDAEEIVLLALEEGGLEDAMLDAIVAKNERERRDIWNVRENSAAVDVEIPNCMWFDVSVPLSRLDDYTGSVDARVAAIDPALGVYALGHLADGNLHYSIGSGEPLSPDVQSAIESAVYGELKQMGGSFSAEHGIGTEKRASLQKFASPSKLALMREIKRVFDPTGIMNPGKVL